MPVPAANWDSSAAPQPASPHAGPRVTVVKDALGRGGLGEQRLQTGTTAFIRDSKGNIIEQRPLSAGDV